jgi:hypothetical protein
MANKSKNVNDIVSQTARALASGKSFGGWTDKVEEDTNRKNVKKQHAQMERDRKELPNQTDEVPLVIHGPDGTRRFIYPKDVRRESVELNEMHSSKRQNPEKGTPEYDEYTRLRKRTEDNPGGHSERSRERRSPEENRKRDARDREFNKTATTLHPKVIAKLRRGEEPEWEDHHDDPVQEVEPRPHPGFDPFGWDKSKPRSNRHPRIDSFDASGFALAQGLMIMKEEMEVMEVNWGGAASGAGTGAMIGSMTGIPLVGTLGGAAIGGLIGAMVPKKKDKVKPLEVKRQGQDKSRAIRSGKGGIKSPRSNIAKPGLRPHLRNARGAVGSGIRKIGSKIGGMLNRRAGVA